MNEKKATSGKFVMRSFPALEEVEYLARSLGWAKASTVEKVPPFSGVEITWSSSDGETLRYVEDEMTGNCYVTVEAPSRELVQRTTETVLDELLPWELEELLFAVDTATDAVDLGLAVIRLSIAAPSHREEQIFQRVRFALTHSDARVRDMAIAAITYSPWPEYKPILRDIAQSDPEQKLRERGGLVLQSFADAGIGGNV